MPNHPIRSESDIYYILSMVRKILKEQNFNEMDQQKVLVSVSELTRNVLDHADCNGSFSCMKIPSGIRIIVSDKGPGIQNLSSILDGHKSPQSKGLGLGLSGVQRLMDECLIDTTTKGTSIVATKWSSCTTRQSR